MRALIGTIKYDKNADGATGNMGAALGGTGDALRVPESGFEYYEHVFLGWSETPDGEPTIRPGVEIVFPNGYKTLYAIWDAIEVEIPETGLTDGSNWMPILCTVGMLTLAAVLTSAVLSRKRGKRAR